MPSAAPPTPSRNAIRDDILVAQHEPVCLQQDVVAEQIVDDGKAKHKQQQEIDRSPRLAAHDALLVGKIVRTQTLL
jgi:hypothetical protein